MCVININININILNFNFFISKIISLDMFGQNPNGVLAVSKHNR